MPTLEYIQVLTSVMTSMAVVVGIYVAMRWLRMRRVEVESAGGVASGVGGYIVLNLPEKLKPFFHDLLKGFEEFASVKGYHLKFSVDNSKKDVVGFKFTVSEGGVDVSTEKVKRDFQDYMDRVKSDDSFDDLPVVTSREEHESALLVLKNRVNFLQHSYRSVKNINEMYERVLQDVTNRGVGLMPNQNFYLMGGGEMQGNNYNAINSNQIAQGENANVSRNILDQSIRIGESLAEKQRQVDLASELAKALEKIDSQETQESVKALGKLREELTDEPKPDTDRIKRWLGTVKNTLLNVKLGQEVVEKGKELLESFGWTIG